MLSNSSAFQTFWKMSILFSLALALSIALPHLQSHSSAFFLTFILFDFMTFRACESVLEALGGVLTGDPLLSLLHTSATSQTQSFSLPTSSPFPSTSSSSALRLSTQQHSKAVLGGFTTWSSTADTTSYNKEEETTHLQALHSAQTAYLNLFLSVCQLEKESAVTVMHVDVFSCAESLSRVLSTESWGPGHRVAAGAVMEHMTLAHASEVSTFSIIFYLL